MARKEMKKWADLIYAETTQWRVVFFCAFKFGLGRAKNISKKCRMAK
jgi:hypothetical protein